MKRNFTAFLPPVLALASLTVCCLLLGSQTRRFRRSVEQIAEDVRVSLIDLSGRVVYDTAGNDLPNHSARAEIEAVKADGRARSVVRESETLHIAMFYHARRVGDYILRIAVPYQSVTDAKTYATYGLLTAIGIGALTVLALYVFTRRYEQRLAHLAAERDLKVRLLDEMNKLEKFRRDFISNVTHEIKTPVTGIVGAIELLTEETTPLSPADRQELQKVLKDQSVRLNALVEDILALSRLERDEADRTGSFVSCDVADVVQTAVNLAQPYAQKTNARLVVEASTGCVRRCDPRLLESAVSNLLQNALRYSGSEEVIVSTRTAPDSKVAISVTDHGVGIPAECQPRLFERFYRVDANRSRALGGTGLGLAIVKHIAQLHGGEVTVSSAPGEGAAFQIVI